MLKQCAYLTPTHCELVVHLTNVSGRTIPSKHSRASLVDETSKKCICLRPSSHPDPTSLRNRRSLARPIEPMIQLSTSRLPSHLRPLPLQCVLSHSNPSIAPERLCPPLDCANNAFRAQLRDTSFETATAVLGMPSTSQRRRWGWSTAPRDTRPSGCEAR